jgi:hypothetical protein
MSLNEHQTELLRRLRREVRKGTERVVKNYQLEMV